MKKYFKNFLMLAVILTFAIIVVPLTSEHSERSEETFNTNFSNSFNINTDFLDSAASSLDLIGTGIDIFVMTWTYGEPSLMTITLTQPYHIDVAQGVDTDDENLPLNPLGYGYLARGVKEVTFRLPHNLEHENGDIYVIVYSEVGVNYGVHKAIDYTGYEKNFLLITDAYHEPQNSDQITKSQTVNADGSYSDDFVSYYINREMSPFDTVSPYGATILPYDVCSMLQIFDYTRFEYGVTFTSEQGQYEYTQYLIGLVQTLRMSNLCDGVIMFCNRREFYSFANNACWDLQEYFGEQLYTCILERETHHYAPNSRDAYISSDAFEKGYAIGYEFIKSGVENSQFIVGENKTVFVVPTKRLSNSDGQNAFKKLSLLEHGIDSGISAARSRFLNNDSMVSPINIDFSIYYCEDMSDIYDVYLYGLFYQTAKYVFGDNRYHILAFKAFYNFIGDFDLGTLNEWAQDEYYSGLPTEVNVFVEDATWYCKENKSIIDGSNKCLLNRYFDADFTSVIGLSKTNALVTIFAKYLMGKTDNFQYSMIVDLAQSRGYTIDGVNYNLYGYYIDYVTRRIAM